MTEANHRPRRAYTLLELVLALGLLGALMSVAWSLMATFREAEERSWKITHRTQVIRSAHDWLQSDAEQITASPSEMPFVGSRLGFTATISPSLDPLPFLQRVMMEQTAASDEEEPEQEFVDDSPWNRDLVQIEYELQPLSQRSARGPADANSPTGDGSTDEVQFALIRRELVNAAFTSGSPRQESPRLGGSLVQEPSDSPSDRLLTGQDLYRQDDSAPSSLGVPISESRLQGLMRPQFQYCDGKTWRSNWNSRSDGGFPVAIALRFDFPARAEMRLTKANPRNDATEILGQVDADHMLDLSPTLSAAEMALASQGEAERESDSRGSLMESDEFEIAMVVTVNRPSGPSLPASAAIDLSQPARAINESALSFPPAARGQSMDSVRGGF